MVAIHKTPVAEAGDVVGPALQIASSIKNCFKCFRYNQKRGRILRS